MKHTPIPSNFIYPEIKEAHHRFSGVVTGESLRPDGDWRPFLPPQEEQNVRGIESSACYVEAQQHSIATMEEALFGEKDNNYSARFNALLSGGTEQGGDPLKAADSIRNDGLVPDAMMPFGENIKSWIDFHSWKGVVESVVRLAGLSYKSQKKISNDILFHRHESVEAKYAKIKQILKFCPPPVSVAGWYQDDNGIYVKPKGIDDNHLVEVVFVDSENHPYIWDTYWPFLKKLEANYNFDFGMRHQVSKRTQQEQLSGMRTILLGILNWIYTQRLKLSGIIKL